MRKPSLTNNSTPQLYKKRRFLLIILLIGVLVLSLMLIGFHYFFFHADILRSPLMAIGGLFSLLPIFFRLQEINAELKHRTQNRAQEAL